MTFEAPQSSLEKPPLTLEISEAEKFIDLLFEKGERPVVTVPKIYYEELQQVLRPGTSWDYSEGQILAGTFGREPEYFDEEDERLTVILEGIKRKQIRVRPTGSDSKFHGIVLIEGPVKPEQFRIIV